MKKSSWEKRVWYCLILIVIVWILTGLHNPQFISFRNILIMIRQGTFIMILALSLYIAVVIGETDFSVVSIAALVGSVCHLLNGMDMSPVLIFSISLLVAAICGLLNGILVTYTPVPAYYLTLGTMFLYFSISSLVSEKVVNKAGEDVFFAIGKGSAGLFPVAVLIMAAIFVCTSVFLNFTYYGRYFFALGNNPTGLIMIGVNYRKYKVLAFVMDAVLAGTAGIIFVSRNNFSSISQNFTDLVQAVFAIIIGGAQLDLGRAHAVRVFLGGLLLVSINQCFNIFSINAAIKNIFCCILFIILIVSDGIKRKSNWRD